MVNTIFDQIGSNDFPKWTAFKQMQKLVAYF